MADIFSKKKRSEIMAKVTGKESVMEQEFRRELSGRGLRYRKNVSYLSGKPDVAFIGKKVVVFLDSCFWHGCKQHCKLPKTRSIFWKKKITRNIERDKEINRYYKKKGWIVVRVWEHDWKKKPEKQIQKVLSAICYQQNK